ncbi:MAG: hypothetical protein ACI9LO_003543 [Planctomycetota bacterium]|jgi:hypothetical protein
MMAAHLLSLDDETLIGGILDNSDDWRECLSILLRRHHDSLVARCYVYFSLKEMGEYLGLGLSATKMRFYRAVELFGVRLKAEQNAI